MERLTERFDDGILKGILVKEKYGEHVPKTLFEEVDEGYLGMCVLKAYEDTGLTPDQIEGLKEHMNDGWIPVEKDLPKNESEVWVVLESTYGTGFRIYSSARYLYFENYGEGHWCDEHYGYLEWDKYSDGRGGSSQYKVIAWRSIAPYRPERSDDHDRE